MATDMPDIYTDGASVSAGPFGITLTLLRSAPGIGQGQSLTVETEIVGRVRMSYALAKDLVRLLGNAVTANESQSALPVSTPSAPAG